MGTPRTPRPLAADLRRWEVRMENTRITEEERVESARRRDKRKGNTEKHRKHGEALVATNKEQRASTKEARLGVVAARDAQGNAVKLEVSALNQQLRDDNSDYTARSSKSVERIHGIHARAKQNVNDVRVRNTQLGYEGKIHAQMLAMEREIQRMTAFEEKCEHTSRVRGETSQEVHGLVRSIKEDEKRAAGLEGRAQTAEGRLQRAIDEQQHIAGAWSFKEDIVKSWRASGKQVRERLEEERRMQAARRREEKRRHKEEIELAKANAAWARKEAHESTVEAKYADEGLEERWNEYLRETLADTGKQKKVVDARTAAAWRATMVRRGQRKQERRLTKQLLKQLEEHRQQSLASIAKTMARAERAKAGWKPGDEVEEVEEVDDSPTFPPPDFNEETLMADAEQQELLTEKGIDSLHRLIAVVSEVKLTEPPDDAPEEATVAYRNDLMSWCKNENGGNGLKVFLNDILSADERGFYIIGGKGAQSWVGYVDPIEHPEFYKTEEQEDASPDETPQLARPPAPFAAPAVAPAVMEALSNALADAKHSAALDALIAEQEAAAAAPAADSAAAAPAPAAEAAAPSAAPAADDG